MSSKQRRGKAGRTLKVKPGSPEAERLAVLRIALILEQVKANPNGVPVLNGPKPTSLKTKGRPRSTAPETMLAQYELDVEHFEALRQLGYGNVPPNKQALDALAGREYPNDPSLARLATLKKKLQRARKRRSGAT